MRRLFTLTMIAATLGAATGCATAAPHASGGEYAVRRTVRVGGTGGFDYVYADTANRLLFATCRSPATMVVLGADDGRIVATLPIGAGTDGAVFAPATREVFSSNGEGTLTVVREDSPMSFAVAHTVTTTPGAKTLAFDARTNRVILIAADFGPSTPPAQPDGRPGRGPMVPGAFRILVVGR